MNRITFLASLSLSLGSSLAAFHRSEARDPPPVAQGNSEIAKPPMPKKDSTGLHYSGVVTEVTKGSITILWPGEAEPKQFAVSETLGSGKFPTQGRPWLDGSRPSVPRSHRYRLSDVKVGDHVAIQFAHLSGVDICDEICIRKRPGGRVPPLPEGAESLKDPLGRDRILYHEQMNAFWDFEDKGIPYPEKFGPLRRFPVAPMPREVKPAPDIVP